MLNTLISEYIQNIYNFRRSSDGYGNALLLDFIALSNFGYRRTLIRIHAFNL